MLSLHVHIKSTLMKKTLSAIIVSCFLFACGNTNEGQESASAISDSVPEQAVHADSMPAAAATTPDNSGALIAPAPVNPSAAPAASNATGLNPAHGEPGHRCDISVGAPLNSAPAAAPSGNPVISTPSSPAAAPVSAPTTNAPAATTAPGMNPPHGEPGHDCAIPVGAPLKK